ncbi:helix-turn-helix transcriptional regulator (plasmid) [Alicyclobacillus fastidiosus]|uniref:Helix-turn-helix transcriptional regulator n=1 Tax=Alicyclobacillus fastidiosus TaxID=392011 RepID=A0ABY6ZPL2_9BACL|nr:helix-turn-helix transcriptional regulator [Alicyclobacillus fastidiosus]WAH44800.1 helix-turn-helix transcriptional regulator [Alicyclobacillus fastidiosus]GMA65757.1 DNA-binding protein [Alicyclobacillus fastidiosus]GMA65930.1 DNA-binding protein [Alicyclobacillus fastidiosus]
MITIKTELLEQYGVRELGRLTGIRAATVMDWKNGTVKHITVDNLNALCRVLGCQPGDLLEYVPDDEE